MCMVINGRSTWLFKPSQPLCIGDVAQPTSSLMRQQSAFQHAPSTASLLRHPHQSRQERGGPEPVAKICSRHSALWLICVTSGTCSESGRARLPFYTSSIIILPPCLSLLTSQEKPGGTLHNYGLRNLHNRRIYHLSVSFPGGLVAHIKYVDWAVSFR